MISMDGRRMLGKIGNTAILLAVVLAAGSLLAEDGPAQPTVASKHQPKGGITVRGCLSTESGDYILMQGDPGNTYELAESGMVKFGRHLGEEVEVSGWQSTSQGTSSDFLGSPSPVTITATGIRTIAKECTAR